jgi:hypothetical protein
MFIKDSYLLTASHNFELKDMQEVTVNIELTKVPPCYHTLLTGKVLHKNIPVKGAVVKVFDCRYNPLFHTVTNDRGVYRFNNILAPGLYKVVAAADSYQTSRTKDIKIKANKVIRKSFQLKKCSIFTNGIIYGKVREVGSKKPIEGASVYLKDEYKMVYKTISNKDGQYIIYNIRPKKYKLHVMKHGYISSNPLELNVDKNDRIMLYIDLKEQCDNYSRTISGVVTWDDKPVPDATIFLYLLGNEGKETIVNVQVTNEEGAFLFSNLEEGTYVLKGKLQSKAIFEKKVMMGTSSKKEEL